MKLKVEQFPSREAWLAARRTGIGGSDAPAILGLSPWMSPLQVWNDKVGLSALDRTPDEAEPIRLRLGTKMEGVVAEMLEEEAGLAVHRFQNAIVRDSFFEGLLCSPDGVATLGDEEVLVELKTADSSKEEEWEEGVPAQYVAQVQHNLGVTGLSVAFLGCVIGGTRNFRWTKIERDEAYIAEVRPRLLEFWRAVKEEKAPPPGGSEGDTKALLARFPQPDAGKKITLGADLLDLTWELDRLKDELDRLTARDTEIRNLVRAALGDAEVGVLPDGTEWSWKMQKRAEYVVKASEFRVLRKKKGKS